MAYGVRMVVLLALAAFCGGLTRAATPEPIASLPFERDNRGTLKVRSVTSEGVALTVLFDSAASNSILFDHKGTARLRPPLGDGHYVYFPFTDQLIDFRTIDWFTLSFGLHNFTSNTWVYGPWKQTGLFPGRDAPNYDVIAGRDVFNNYTVAVDPAARRIRLYTGGQDIAPDYQHALNLVNLNPLIAVQVTYTRGDTGETSQKLMVIDTGFDGVLLFANEAELAALKASDITAPADTLNDAIKIRGHLQLGSLPAFGHDALIVSRGSFAADGVMGAAFLGNYRYAIDLKTEKLYLAVR